MVDKYKERFCDSFAVKLWKTAYQKSEENVTGSTQEELEECVHSLYGADGTLQIEIDRVPALDWQDKERKAIVETDYNYRRLEAVMKLMRADYETK